MQWAGVVCTTSWAQFDISCQEIIQNIAVHVYLPFVTMCCKSIELWLLIGGGFDYKVHNNNVFLFEGFRSFDVKGNSCEPFIDGSTSAYVIRIKGSFWVSMYPLPVCVLVIQDGIKRVHPKTYRQYLCISLFITRRRLTLIEISTEDYVQPSHD